MFRLETKRMIDVTAAASLLVMFSPVMLLAAIAVRVLMGPPVLWCHVPPGKGGAPFVMYKFRSMAVPLPDENWLRTNAERLTPLGRLLRKASIDELPELWNVLKGDMSLVGPRPLLLEYLPRYTDEQRRRHQVRPGITGWAQVNGRQSITLGHRIAYDLWYIDNQGTCLDFRILLKTVRQALTGAGVISRQDFSEFDDLHARPKEGSGSEL